MPRVFILSAALLLAVLPSHAFWWGEKAQSRRLDRPIVVDGDAADWKDAELDDAEGFSYAFANDDKNLYLLFSPHTKGTRTQLSGRDGQSVSLWVDPKGGKAKTIGLTLAAPVPGDDGRELLTVGIDTAAASVELKVGDVDARGILEARVPLSVVGSSLPAKITIAIETSAPTRPHPRAEERNRAAERQPNPATGGGRRGRGGERSDPAEEAPETLLWIQVTLAPPAKG